MFESHFMQRSRLFRCRKASMWGKVWLGCKESSRDMESLAIVSQKLSRRKFHDKKWFTSRTDGKVSELGAVRDHLAEAMPELFFKEFYGLFWTNHLRSRHRCFNLFRFVYVHDFCVKLNGILTGDSGQALVVNRKGKKKIVGIVSNGYESCETMGEPEIFTRVDGCIRFIEETIKRNWNRKFFELFCCDASSFYFDYLSQMQCSVWKLPWLCLFIHHMMLFIRFTTKQATKKGADSTSWAATTNESDNKQTFLSST